MQNNSIQWDESLITRYNLSGPRYTSYPTAIQFDQQHTTAQLVKEAQRTTNVFSPLSLYAHIPFCTHVCYFCACNKVITRKKDRASPYLAVLMKEAITLSKLYAANRPVNQLHLGGGTPTFLTDGQIEQFIENLHNHFSMQTGDHRDYSIEIDPREADGKRIENLARLGFNRISLGVQDTSEKVQKAVNRIQPLSLTEELVYSARNSGMKSINFDLIYGLPYQSASSFTDTLDKVIALSPDRLSIFNYAHMPDRFRPQRHIQTNDLPPPAEKLKILENTIDQLLNNGYVYIGMDHFAKPNDELAIAQQAGKLHRNFQGYTTHNDCDLVAMGVSGISQVGDTYYQNHHDISEYESRIGDTGHAINRGVTLNQDDKIRGEVISQLICHFHLDTLSIENKYGIHFSDYFSNEIEMLVEMANDGLTLWKDKVLTITPRGRLLVRNICMVFDAYVPKISHHKYSRII